MKITEYLKTLEEYAPLYLSKAFIEKGARDNSGIIIKASDEVTKAVFSLDLSKKAIELAKNTKADLIVTHHPAIYYPISEIGVSDDTKCLLEAAKNGISVISMHLNLDIAGNGIDESLAKALGAKSCACIAEICPPYGYGREFDVDFNGFDEFVKAAVKKLSAKNYLTDKTHDDIKKVASFCGGGSSDAAEYVGNADTIVTSDMPHHVVKKLVESGKNILVLTHYASEFYGFKKFYENFSSVIPSEILTEEIYL